MINNTFLGNVAPSIGVSNQGSVERNKEISDFKYYCPGNLNSIAITIYILLNFKTIQSILRHTVYVVIWNSQVKLEGGINTTKQVQKVVQCMVLSQAVKRYSMHSDCGVNPVFYTISSKRLLILFMQKRVNNQDANMDGNQKK